MAKTTKYEMELFIASEERNKEIALSFNEGIAKAKGLIEAVQRKSILAAVYGWPNCGKCYFMKRLKESLNLEDFEVMCGSGAPMASTFEDHIGGLLKYEEISQRKRLYLFHCGWERVPFEIEQDPNALSQNILHRSLDLNIGIWCPKFYRTILGNYDIVIANSDAVRKKPL